jgi:hypothetical protein
MPTCQATWYAHLQRAIPAANTRPVRVFSQDDRRLGWLTVRRRRRTASGVPPVGAVPHVCAWCSVDGAVAPTTGERFFRERPSLPAEGLQLFVDACAAAFPDRLHLRLLDHRGAPTAPRLILPAHVRLVCLPPYGPELHPIARVWRDRKEALAWRQCPHRDVPQDDIAHLLRGDQAVTLQALTGSPSLVDAMHALGI